MHATVPPRTALAALAALALAALAALALALLPACIPYGVGTTAHPAPRGRLTQSSVVYAAPEVDALRAVDDGSPEPDRGVRGLAVDAEARWGVDERTDVGVRVPAMSGIVVNAKRRLGARVDSTRAAVAVMGGAGLLNWGNHAHLELTVVASGPERRTATPYGGVRVMQVLPLSSGVPSDTPTAGLFAGVRLGTARFGISPELGVFHDESALGVRRSRVVVVPSITLHGTGLLRALRGLAAP